MVPPAIPTPRTAMIGKFIGLDDYTWIFYGAWGPVFYAIERLGTQGSQYIHPCLYSALYTAYTHLVSVTMDSHLAPPP